jgi:peptidyl-prolyl cis-trans isomerase A (cyclophilin A)
MNTTIVRRTLLSSTSALALSALLLCCKRAPPEPESQDPAPTQKTPTTAAITEKEQPPQMKVAEVPVSPDDPLKGKFSLEDATKDLKGEGKLIATLETEFGDLSCELFEDKAPITVANFVGLARGLRPFKVDGTWVTRPGYDGSTFHRIVKGFMIQGGDPKGNGTGEPGYVIPDEIWPGSKHDERGLLCMANRGPNTNGMQFFITDAAAPHLDRGYTIFGKCGPDKVMETLATQPVKGQSAVTPPKIKKVTIERKG